METVYDWITLAIFAGLIVLFLQRSSSETSEQNDSLLLYLIAGVGCATANYFGNAGQNLIGAGLIALTLAFILYFLRPFGSTHSSGD